MHPLNLISSRRYTITIFQKLNRATFVGQPARITLPMIYKTAPAFSRLYYLGYNCKLVSGPSTPIHSPDNRRYLRQKVFYKIQMKTHLDVCTYSNIGLISPSRNERHCVSETDFSRCSRTVCKCTYTYIQRIKRASSV